MEVVGRNTRSSLGTAIWKRMVGMIPGESVPPRRSASAPPSLPFLRRFGAAAGQLPPRRRLRLRFGYRAWGWRANTEPRYSPRASGLTHARVHTPFGLRLLCSVLRLPIADLTRGFVTHCEKGLPAKINKSIASSKRNSYDNALMCVFH